MAPSLPTARSFLPSFLLSLIIGCLVSGSAIAGAVSGRIVNRTLSRPVPNCEIILIRHGAASADTWRDTTDTDGGFRFDGSTAGDDTTRVTLSVTYAGVDYLHRVEGDGREPVEFPVYEATDADSAVSLTSHHIVVDAVADEVTHVLIVRNAGNRTYRSSEGHGLEFPLPEGVREILKGSQGIHAHGPTIVDPQPVQPGRGQLVYAHRMPSGRRLVQPVRYPTGSVDVLITPSNTPVVESSLRDLGEVTIGRHQEGHAYRRLSSGPLNPGDRILLQLTPVISRTWISRNREGLKWTLGGLAVVLALLAFVFRPKRRASATTEKVARPSKGKDLRARREELLAKIADMDDGYSDGQIAEADYRSRRDTLKDELVRITRALDSPEA